MYNSDSGTYLGLCQVSEMTPFVGVVDCISLLMCGSH